MANLVLVDTSAWIDFLRGTPSDAAAEVRRLATSGRVATCGVVVAELLYGVRVGEDASGLADRLLALPYFALSAAGHVRAGTVGAQLRRRGVTVPLSDIIVGSTAREAGVPVLTLDPHFAMIPDVRLHPPEP
jgi:predicted nucleic acid-binding protein